MNFLRKYKIKFIAVVAFLLCTLLIAGCSSQKQECDVKIDNVTETPMVLQTPLPSPTHDNISTPSPEKVKTPEPEKVEKQVKVTDEEQKEATADENTKVVMQNTPQPAEEEVDKELTCTLSVRCDTILQNMELLDSGKTELIPQSGTIFSERTVTFYEGESVFNLLTREMKKNGIHLEFVNVPVYNSAYIEGIANIYEFDCGELSGWMYKVNGYFPNYGCSTYQLKAGDRVEFVYTCDLGNDVGGGYSARNGM